MNHIRDTLTKFEVLLLAAGAVVLVMCFSPAEAGGTSGTGCEHPARDRGAPAAVPEPPGRRPHRDD